MSSIPLHDFDEANRTEAAKNMREYKFYLAPLTGSPYLRNKNLKIPVKDNKNLNLYIHLERPPLFFWLMIISNKIFGDNEFAYRLPSFIFGLLTIGLTFLFNPISTLTIITSSDFWLSSQSALMDTTLTFFLFVAFLFLIRAVKTNKNHYFYLTGLSLGLGILSKGQPAVIFIFPLFYLLLVKKISLKNLFQIILTSTLIVFPWLFFIIKKFGFDNFYQGFFNFAQSRTLVPDTTQQAPIFWYLRWWFESFRLGLILFLSAFLYDLKNLQFNLEKKLTLFYFFTSFLFFSIAKNKVWWYVLPLIPIISYYIHLSVSELLKKDKNKLFNFSIIILLSSLPFLYQTRNLIALILISIYGFLGFLILNKSFNFSINLLKIFFSFSLIFSLTFFYFHFPKINPTYPETKRVGDYYQKLPQPKCLYVENMPYESALFYTNAKEINYLTAKTKLRKNCNNHLITPNTKNYQLIFQVKRLKLYKL